MGFMDMFRPKYKHSDWNVRAEVAETTNNQEILSYLAKYDEDWLVREKAIKRLSDTDVETLKYYVIHAGSSVRREEALKKMKENDVPPEFKEEYFKVQKKWKAIEKGNEFKRKLWESKREEGRADREKDNKREGHQCPHCGSYNLSVRSDAGIHCWDCDRDSLHYL